MKKTAKYLFGLGIVATAAALIWKKVKEEAVESIGIDDLDDLDEVDEEDEIEIELYEMEPESAPEN